MCELLPVGLRSVEVVSSWRTEAQRKTQGLEGASGRAFFGGIPTLRKTAKGGVAKLKQGQKGASAPDGRGFLPCQAGGPLVQAGRELSCIVQPIKPF